MKDSGKNKNGNKKKFQLPTNPWVYILLVLAVVMAFNMFSMGSMLNGNRVEYVEYSTFLNMVDSGQVSAVELTDTVIRFTVSSGMFPWRSETSYATYPVEDPGLVQRLYEANVAFGGVSAQSQLSFFDILCYNIPIFSAGKALS